MYAWTTDEEKYETKEMPYKNEEHIWSIEQILKPLLNKSSRHVSYDMKFKYYQRYS